MIIFPILLLLIGSGFIYSTVHFRNSLTSDHTFGLCTIGFIMFLISCITFGVLNK